MKTKSIIPLLLPVILSASAAYSQISYYKVQNGVKTLLKEGEDVTITLDGNFIPDCNIMVEIDLKKFKAAYKYENLVLEFMQSTTGEYYTVLGSFGFTFDANVNMKKYGDAQYLHFYVFETADAQSDNMNMFLYKSKGNGEMTQHRHIVKVSGRYREKVEEYYENHAWKTRDIFSKSEFLGKSPHIIFVANEEAQVNIAYSKLIADGYEVSDGVKGIKKIGTEVGDEHYTIKKMEISIPVVGSSPAYPNIADAIDEIKNHREKTIRDETDKAKAVELLKQWNKDYVHLLVSKKDKSVLKALNKELKDQGSIESKMEIFRKHNP